MVAGGRNVSTIILRSARAVPARCLKFPTIST
ncbi:hypothetical protein CABS03_06862 [Colletotrichum abscissum]|uniref:Uncharacterized protein n=1 Tax=Colletotrichum abscissum TaxID=1671311 RepID=A0A9Q0AZM2_9PEZI|nr:hypothetical protein CABS02_13029 [Colletotrichum abscissum]